MPMTFIEVTDDRLVKWSESADGTGTAVFKEPVGFSRFNGLSYHGVRYKIFKVTVDHRTVTFKRLEKEPAKPAKQKTPSPEYLAGARNSDPWTSKAAAETLDTSTGDYRVATLLYEVYPAGLIFAEMEDLYHAKGWPQNEEWHKRTRTLWLKGWVEDSGQTRANPKNGRPQIVWVLTPCGVQGMEKLAGNG